MINSIKEVLPKEAERFTNCDADINELKKFIYNHNYKVRGEYDT